MLKKKFRVKNKSRDNEREIFKSMCGIKKFLKTRETSIC